MYKNASRIALRVQTAKGPLSVEQLWHLSLKDLDKVAVSLDTELESMGKKSFLTPKTGKDSVTELSFEIVKDILKTKVAESSAALTAAENKAHNQKVMGIIAAKQDEKLANMSVEELESLLKE